MYQHKNYRFINNIYRKVQYFIFFFFEKCTVIWDYLDAREGYLDSPPPPKKCFKSAPGVLCILVSTVTCTVSVNHVNGLNTIDSGLIKALFF